MINTLKDFAIKLLVVVAIFAISLTVCIGVGKLLFAIFGQNVVLWALWILVPIFTIYYFVDKYIKRK